MSTEVVVITTTADNLQLIENIAGALVKEGLAACCQISGPLKSIYRWQGKTETAQEYSCAIKTVAAKVENVKARIVALHSYDTPEILVTAVLDGHREYLDWVKSVVDSE